MVCCDAPHKNGWVEVRHLFSKQIKQKVELVQVSVIKDCVSVGPVQSVFLILESKQPDKSQVVIGLRQLPHEVQIRRLTDAKMWDALEQYYQLLVDQGLLNK